ncbi:MAG: hypothetical protein NTZ98_23165, partial [Acidobacteria bacterium]|nr:hypothetical protein [Acidobacteriota bacterium]
MEPFLTQLTELCRNKPWQTKWVIVPNHALGRMIGERLARAGVAWANLRFTPPFDLALQIAGADLASSGVGLFDEGAAPALVLRLLLDLPPVVTSYFRVLADQPGIAEALWSALRDLRFACLSSDRVVAEAFANADKQRELQALFTSYEAYLATNRLLDSAGVLELAAQRAADLSTVPADTLIEFPGTCTTLLERRFLDALPVDRLRARQIEIPGLQQPRRYAQFGRPLDVHRAPQEQLSDTDRLRYLLVPRTAPPPAGDGTLEMFRAAGVEAEVEEAFRRIASRRLSLDSVEIACAQPDRYAALLWEKARRQEWPVTLQMGVPGPLTGPVRAVLALCDWITSDFSAAQLVRMLQSGDLSPGWNGELTAVAAGRIIRSSGATSGRETYATCLAAEAAVARARSEDSEFGPDRRAYYTERAAQTEIIAEWLRELLESMPMPSRDGTVRLGDLVDACAAFASQASMLSGEDGAAAKAIPNALEALSPLTDLPRPPALILGLVRAELQGLRVCAEPPRSGSLYVTWLPTAGYSGRKHVFVLGLEEGAVFPRGSEDPVLLDSEREALAPDALAVSDDKVTQTVHDCIRRLASLQGNTCLSFSCRDLRKGRETLPSWIMLNAFLLLNPAAQLRYADFNPYVGEPVSVVPGEPSRATTSNTWWLATLRGLGPASMPAVLEAFSGLARGVEAESRRDGAEFTPYD